MTVSAFMSAYRRSRSDSYGSARLRYAETMNLLCKRFGEVPMANVTAAQLREWFTQEPSASPELARQVRYLFQVALQDGWISDNPAERLGKREATAYVDRDQALQMLAAMPTVKYRAMFALVRFCGLHTYEAAKLRLEDIDVERQVITVNGMHGKRTTPLLEPVTELLKLPGALSFTIEVKRLGQTINQRYGPLRRPVLTLRHSLARDMHEAGIPFRAYNAWLHFDHRRTQFATAADNRTAQRELRCKLPAGKGLELLLT